MSKSHSMQLHRIEKTIVFLITTIINLHHLQVSSTTDTLRPGDRLNSTSRLVSANGSFALGFYTPTGTRYGYVAIWFSNRTDVDWLSERGTNYPVWIGNRDEPVPVPDSNTTLTISTSGKLLIAYSSNEEAESHPPPIELYAGRETSGKNNTFVSAVLLDSGNFVVKEMTVGTDNTGTRAAENETGINILWESFDYPTDTLIPGMRLGINHRTGIKRVLRSWLGELNPGSGTFTLEWDPSWRRLLIRRRGVVIWTSGRLMERNPQELPGFENLRWGGCVSANVTSTINEEYFSFSFGCYNEGESPVSMRLDYSGDLTVRETHLTRNARVSLCDGYNTELSSSDQVYGVGCELWEQPKCRSRGQTFVLRSGSFSWLDAAGPELVPNLNLSESDCKENCWNDCKCFAFVWVDRRVSPKYAGCMYWRGTHFKFDQTLDGSGDRQYVLLTPDESMAGKRKMIEIITIPVIVVLVLLTFGTALLIARKHKEKKRKEKELHELMRLDGYTDAYELENGGLPKGQQNLTQFSYASILEATDNFSSHNKLGEGGFGPVYKGKLLGGHDIAVKLLSRRSEQGLREFKTELILISKLQHVNLVKLQGFCIHGADKLIVYDYMPNKSLDFFLFDPSEREKLDWGRRFSIIEGIAQGLLYLHKHSRLKIIHRDLKSNNILLDENMNPKISDFVLAKIFKPDEIETNTQRRVGTYGYMAPEYAMQGIFSMKSDVYSFGVLILEIASGRRNNSFRDIEGPLNLVEYAWEVWNKGCAQDLMDPTLKNSCNIDQFQRCINIGLLCVENRAIDRPTIEDVISMLRNEMPSLSIPKNPAFVTRNGVVEELEKSTPDKISCNELTLSETVGR